MHYVSAGFAASLAACLLFTSGPFAADAAPFFTPAQKSYWAFQHAKKSTPPAVENQAWVKTESKKDRLEF